MITFEYSTIARMDRLNNLSNRLTAGVRDTMQVVLDAVVANIQGKFTDRQLAQTVISFIDDASAAGGADFTVTGHVTSTWANMIWHELGRKPGGKMPPIDAMLAYINKHGIKPDPKKTLVSFAYAANYNRANKRNLHELPIDVLVNWAEDKGITPTDEFALRSLAFAFAKKIQRDGVPGKHFFQQGLDESRALIHESFESVAIRTNGI